MMQSVVVSGHFPMRFWPLPPPLSEPNRQANAQSQRQSLFNFKNKMNTIVEIDTLVSKINNTVDMKLQAEGTIIGWILPLVVVCQDSL